MLLEEQMQSISILGCGWLGLPLGKRLVREGYRVKGSTTSDDKMLVIEESGIESFKLKVSNQLIGENITPFFQSNVLFLNIPPKRSNSNIEQEYPIQVQKVLERAKLEGVNCIIFASSTGVYGDDNKVVTEEDDLKPTRGSGVALVEAEQIVQKSGLQWVIFRFAGLVGGDRKAGRFLAGKTNLLGGQAPVNLVHQKDCVEVVVEILKQQIWNEIFNVCADKHPLKQIYYVELALKEGVTPPSFNADTSPKYKIVSNEKLKQRLNYSFIYPDPMLFD